jgi:hypothetical protein
MGVQRFAAQALCARVGFDAVERADALRNVSTLSQHSATFFSN